LPGRIREEDVGTVRERSDIVKVISGYLQLRKAGADRMVGLCPFHTEKTGSLSVSPSKQLFYCFGCGEGGDVFRFVQKLESLTFSEAVEKLTAEAGVTVRYEGQSGTDRKASNRRAVLSKAVAEAGRLFTKLLLEGNEAKDARDYLAERGISPQSVERFGIGYAPGYPDFLLRRLGGTFSGELLAEAGLVSKDAGGRLRDRFRGRVMFPIHDLSGAAIGFGGRLLPGPNTPAGAAKYVNSAESPIYNKGRILYNLHRAKAEITRSGRAFIVEGYTDVIALDQGGIPTAVATCGTALGEDHVKLLSRFAGTAILTFDADEAGAGAAARAYKFHQQYPLNLLVLVLPEGLDPADFMQQRGEAAAEELDALMERAVPLVEFMLDRTLRGFDLNDPESRDRAVLAGVPIVAGLEDQVRRQEYSRVLAGKARTSEGAVLFEVDKFAAMDPTVAGERSGGNGSGTRREPARSSPEQRVEKEAMKLLIQAPGSFARATELREDHFSTARYRKAFDVVRSGAAETPGGVAAMVARAEQESGEQVAKVLAALAVERVESADGATSDYAERVFLRLEELSLKRKADEIRRRLERLNPIKAGAEYDQLYERFVRLEGQRRRVREAAEDLGHGLPE